MTDKIKISDLPVFDITEHLDSNEAIMEYFNLVLEGGDIDELMRAFAHIAKAKGMTDVLRHELDTTTHGYA